MVASSSVSMGTSGSARPRGRDARSSAHGSTPGAVTSVRTEKVRRSCRSRGSRPASRVSRSSSATRVTAPQSSRPYPSSSAVHQALSGTAMAPRVRAAQKKNTNSG